MAATANVLGRIGAVAEDFRLPIPDRRPGAASASPSEDLCDVVAQCAERQAWYRDHARSAGDGPVEVVGSLDISTDAVAAAAAMRTALDFDVGQRGSMWRDASRRLAANAELLGVLVMVSGVVGTNSRRKLDPEEFSGFALADELAPVVFVNGGTTRALHLFAMAHALAHVWLGDTAVSIADPRETDGGGDPVERWCDEVAAELAVPLDALEERFTPGEPLTDALARLVRAFKVSPPVMLRRLHDAGLLIALSDVDDEYEALYDASLERLVEEAAAKKGSGGGNFYNTQPVRVSKRFARTLISSTMQGRTPDAVALKMLGVKSSATLKEMGRRLGVD